MHVRVQCLHERGGLRSFDGDSGSGTDVERRLEAWVAKGVGASGAWGWIKGGALERKKLQKVACACCQLASVAN